MNVPTNPLEASRLAGVLAELARRKCEALRLYEPLASQAAFHASLARERLVVGGNQSGKTLSAAVEVARAVTLQDPYGKYPAEGGLCVCIGKDLKHIARVMWPKLYTAGAFRMIRDTQTKAWRSFRPWDAEDWTRKKEAKRAPSLIPHRLIEAIAWENKKESMPSYVTLKTGWTLWFYSSLGKPGQGFQADLAWFDEEIVDSDWYNEIALRLLARGGRLIWSATPQAATDQLYNLHDRADDNLVDVHGQKLVEEFSIQLDDNPHISIEDKQATEAKLVHDEQAYLVRIKGKWAIEGYKVYPEFSTRIHGCEPFPVPRDWCWYAAVDPGTQVCGVLFLAVPPPYDEEHKDFVYCADECYIKRCNAVRFGEEMAPKADGRLFEAFLIDPKSGRVQEIGVGRTIQEQYAEQLALHHVKSRLTQHNFLWGSEDAAGGREMLRSWLRIGASGQPKLKVFRGCCPNLEWEFDRYHYRRDPSGTITDKPLDKHDHLMWGARTLAAFQPYWHKPTVRRPKSSVLEYLRKKRKRQKQGMAEDADMPSVRLGPRS